jgi:hypothetical protein
MTGLGWLASREMTGDKLWWLVCRCGDQRNVHRLPGWTGCALCACRRWRWRWLP